MNYYSVNMLFFIRLTNGWILEYEGQKKKEGLSQEWVINNE